MNSLSKYLKTYNSLQGGDIRLVHTNYRRIVDLDSETNYIPRQFYMRITGSIAYVQASFCLSSRISGVSKTAGQWFEFWLIRE